MAMVFQMHLDLDSDNDGIYDMLEGGDGSLDTNNDGMIDAKDSVFLQMQMAMERLMQQKPQVS